MRLLVTSKSQGGKTTFCKRLLCYLSGDYFNNDYCREKTNNWDFSLVGRKLAAQNVRKFCDNSSAELKIIDMICPTKELRKILAPDIIVFIDHDGKSKYSDTNDLYETPEKNECRALFVAKFDRHQKTIDDLIRFLNQNPQL